MRTLLRQTLPILILTGFGSMGAGFLLTQTRQGLELIPGLIVVVPAIIALRGNISATLGSRLGSAMHLGLIPMKNLFNIESKENAKASLYLSIILPLLTGVAAYLSSITLGFEIHWLKLMLITFLTGFLAGVVLTPLTLGIAFLAFKKGLDPDNVVAPSISLLGDLTTLFFLFVNSNIIWSL